MTDEDRKVTVCAACLCACCWQGKLMCEEAKTASTVELPISELREAAREDPGYWSVECDAGER
jgi:hypothetical protein